MPIRTDRYESIAGEVLAVYEEAESLMLERVANRLLDGIDQPGWTESKHAEMRAVRARMSATLNDAARRRRSIQGSAIVKAYDESSKAAQNDIYRLTLATGAQGLTPNAMKVVNIMSELDSMMDAADRRILRSVNDEYANIVGRVTALVATGSITYRDAVKRELEQFGNKGIVSFVDKAGRQWDMETYAEMATLTAIERATREGYLDTCEEFGYDLVEVSSHYGACPLCEPWQNVVLSISGQTPGFHSLADAEGAGLFHPRCMHDLSAYHMGISRGGRIEPKPVTEPSPGYTVRQQQRGYERQIRKWKRRMQTAADPQSERDAYNRVRMYQQKIRDLRRDYNEDTDISIDYLPRKYWREGGTVKLSAAAKRTRPGGPKKQTGSITLESIKNSTTKLRGVLSQNDYDTAVGLIHKSPLARLYQKLGDAFKSISQTNRGVYKSSEDRVEFSFSSYVGQSRYSTLFHELAHMFDRHLGRDGSLTFKEAELINDRTPILGGRYTTLKVGPSTSDQFLAAMRKDRAALEKVLNDRDALNEIRSTNASAGLQDAMDGFFSTQDKRILIWGHGDKYYNRAYNQRVKQFGNDKALKQALQELGFDASNQTKVKQIMRDYETASELWANTLSALTCGGKELEVMEKYMPETMKAAREIIGGLLYG